MQLYAARLNSVKLLCYRIDNAISRRRLLAGLAIPTFQAIGADLVAQMSQNRKTLSLNDYSNDYYGFTRYQNNNLLYKFAYSIDWNRTMVFATFGFCYLGAAQYILYVKLLNKTFERIVDPIKQKTLDKTLKVLFDQCIHTPFMYFPAFYFIKDRLEQTSNNNQTSNKNKNVPIYRLPSKDDMIAAWSLWVPAQIVTFSLERHWRLPWVASVSFIWTVILSNRSMD